MKIYNNHLYIIFLKKIQGYSFYISYRLWFITLSVLIILSIYEIKFFFVDQF